MGREDSSHFESLPLQRILVYQFTESGVLWVFWFLVFGFCCCFLFVCLFVCLFLQTSVNSHEDLLVILSNLFFLNMKTWAFFLAR